MKHGKLKGSKDKRVKKKNMKKGAKLIVWKFLKRRHFLLCVASTLIMVTLCQGIWKLLKIENFVVSYTIFSLLFLLLSVGKLVSQGSRHFYP